MVHLQKLQEKYASKGVAVACILTNDAAGAQQCAKENKVTYPVLVDGDQKVTSTVFGLKGHPWTLIVDRKGVVQSIESGSKDENYLSARIDALLK